MHEIFPLPTLIQFTDFIGGIKHFVTVLGRWIFDRNIPFVLFIARVNMYCCYINYDKTKVMDYYKGVLQSVRFIKTERNKYFIQK